MVAAAARGGSLCGAVEVTVTDDEPDPFAGRNVIQDESLVAVHEHVE
jgi:hypothetical protein